MPSVMEVLSYIEQNYYQNNLLPTKEKVQEHFQLTPRSFAALTRRKEFITAYQARGLPSYKTVKQNDKGLLTPIQLATANILLNTHDRTTLRKKLQALNVTTAQFQAWQKQPAFQDYLRSESIARFNTADVDARLGLVKLVQDADLQAIKYYFEVSGIHNPNAQPIVDLSRILASVLELLVKYLAPAQLLEVAESLESILNGTITSSQAVEASSTIAIEASSTIEALLPEEFADESIQGDEYNPGPERDSTPLRKGFSFSLSGLRLQEG